jgi:hypothetical protein
MQPSFKESRENIHLRFYRYFTDYLTTAKSSNHYDVPNYVVKDYWLRISALVATPHRWISNVFSDRVSTEDGIFRVLTPN